MLNLNNMEEIVQPVHGDLGPLPPPPPLPTDLAQFKKLKRAMDNDGVGTMSAYMALKKTQLEQEATHVIDAEEEDLGKIDDTVAIVGGIIQHIPKRLNIF